MTPGAEVTVTAPAVWASRVPQLALLLRSCADGTGPSVIPDPSGSPPDPTQLTAITVPAFWADQPAVLSEALAFATSHGPASPVSSRTAAGATAPVEQRLVYTVEEAALLLGLSRSFAYEAVQRGEIPSMRIGKRILVPKAALERFLIAASQSVEEKPGE